MAARVKIFPRRYRYSKRALHELRVEVLCCQYCRQNISVGTAVWLVYYVGQSSTPVSSDGGSCGVISESSVRFTGASPINYSASSVVMRNCVFLSTPRRENLILLIAASSFCTT
jgi:hypothetical protein